MLIKSLDVLNTQFNTQLPIRLSDLQSPTSCLCNKQTYTTKQTILYKNYYYSDKILSIESLRDIQKLVNPLTVAENTPANSINNRTRAYYTAVLYYLLLYITASQIDVRLTLNSRILYPG